MSHPLAGTVRGGICECGHSAKVGEITDCTRCECGRHVAIPRGGYAGNDPGTPAGAEAMLNTFMDALEPAREALEAAMNEAVEARMRRDAAKRRWLFSEECQRLPTLTERKLWAEGRIEDEERECQLAEVKVAAAKTVLDVLGRQTSAQQSITKSIGQSYQGTRGEGRW